MIESRPRLTSHNRETSTTHMAETGDEETSDIFTRKKKAEKLEGFFGDKLTKSQLEEQNLKKKLPEPVPLNQQSDDEEDAPKLPPTTHQLTAEERNTIGRSARKLQAVLGEAFSEDVTAGLTGVAAGQVASGGSVARRKSNYAKARTFFELGSQPEYAGNVSELRRSLHLDDENAIIVDLYALPPTPASKDKVSVMAYPTSAPITDTMSSPLRSTSTDEIETLLKEELFETDGGQLKKELRRRKLAKIQAFLGEVSMHSFLLLFSFSFSSFLFVVLFFFFCFCFIFFVLFIYDRKFSLFLSDCLTRLKLARTLCPNRPSPKKRKSSSRRSSTNWKR